MCGCVTYWTQYHLSFYIGTSFSLEIFFPIYFIYINHFYVKSESFSVFINLCGSSQRLDQKYILNSIIRKMTDYVAKGQSIVQSGPRLANLSPSTKVVGDYGRMEDLANWMDSCLLTITSSSSSSSLTSRDDWWFVYVPDRVPCTTNTTNQNVRPLSTDRSLRTKTVLSFHSSLASKQVVCIQDRSITSLQQYRYSSRNLF